MNKPTICPICGNPIQSYYETEATKPYTHTNPFLGIEIWGTLHDGKQTICCNDQYVHFVFPYDNEHLARLRWESNRLKRRRMRDANWTMRKMIIGMMNISMRIMTTHDLYINNLGALILFGCKYVDRADSEDIVADLYLKIKDKTDLDRSYLFTSVYNACMNLIAKKKPIHDLPERAEEQVYVIEAEVYRRIDDAINRLPQHQPHYQDGHAGHDEQPDSVCIGRNG